MSEVSIDFQKIIESEHSDPEETRKQLVERLRTGISLDVEGKKVTFVLRENQGSSSNLVGIDVVADGKRILFVETIVNFETATASKTGKYYDKDTADNYKGIGLVASATSLLFQVLEHIGVEKVIGKIEIDNVPSINSRLRTKDLVQGGFYKVEIHEPIEAVPSWRSSGKKNYSVITHLIGDRGNIPLTLEDALAK